ncbi:rRNA maturation factor [Mesobacillus campisalis]|uniref:Endoribonuclease YbeY n=1 Tax=Mesobacillus campisalis TaxID=1408103 RepID=A0A0M2SFU8_9BACI|nr:rRNA maturation RNase YbeY [Mesobacillus campisalis]KKK33158.1 rRNA maturation factor [Mesobacillus campisalis]
MTLEIDLFDEVEELGEYEMAEIEKLLNFAAQKEGVEAGSEVSVTFVSNKRIHEINLEYRKIDRPTDVISFALEEEGEGELTVTGAQIPRVLGDIIISVAKAREQAEEYNHSFMRELGFLAVHGFLHLLGYDHETEEDEKAMFSRQREILNEYGLIR